MAAACFGVDTDNLRKDASTLRQYLRTIEQTSAGLRDNITRVSSMWDGPAREAFYHQFMEDCEELSEIANQIRGIIDSLEDAAKEYDSCNCIVRSIVDSIRM